VSNYDDLPGTKSPTKVWGRGVPMDANTLQQVRRAADLPVTLGVAVMPDAHVGVGATVGTVIVTRAAVPPAAVGVDIGCGMVAVRLAQGFEGEGLHDGHVDESRGDIYDAILGEIPVGGPGAVGSWTESGGSVPADVMAIWGNGFERRWKTILHKNPGIDRKGKRGVTYEQLGTLGTGNHFIEVCRDLSGAVWVMLRSGSRGLGNRVGTYFIDRAKQEWIQTNPRPPLGDPNLAYLTEGTLLFDDYVEAVGFAQEFAAVNRKIMLARVLRALASVFPAKVVATSARAINCHHNYVTRERVAVGPNGGDGSADAWVTRKGAISARLGELGIIPGSMGARSYIVAGLGSLDSFQSSSHGAGRRMSRGQARREIPLADHVAAQAGIACRADETTLDEARGAYKDIDAVMAAQSDLVEVVATLSQLVCVKG